MTSRVILVLLALTANAGAESKRKGTPDKYAKAASAAFLEAVAAEERGDLQAASDLYAKAFEIAPHASTAYNLASVLLRSDRVTAAITYFDLYLAMAPQASDQQQVRAVLTSLETRPVTIEIKSTDGARERIDLTTAYILVDGDIISRPGGKAPFVVKLSPGRHRIDVVTAITSSNVELELEPGQPDDELRIKATPRRDGNVIYSARTSITAFINTKGAAEKRVTSGAEVSLPPGTHRIGLATRYECPPIAVTVPKGDDLAYVYAEELQALPPVVASSFPTRCRKLVIKQHKLTF